MTGLACSPSATTGHTTDLEIACVTGMLRSPNLSLGPKLVEFEKKMAQCVRTKRAWPTSYTPAATSHGVITFAVVSFTIVCSSTC